MPLAPSSQAVPEAGPSTPSKKRSRWEGQEYLQEDPLEPQPPPKRRSKSKGTSLSDPRSQAVTPEPRSRSQNRVVVVERQRPRHSIYVPPRIHHPPLTPSRSVYSYERLNSIEEGSYGVVFRAKDKETGDIVALKKLKLDEEKNGFPITALREINALMSCQHEHVVGIREVVVGETLTQYVLHAHVQYNYLHSIQSSDFPPMSGCWLWYMLFWCRYTQECSS